MKPPTPWIALANTILTDQQPSQRKIAARLLARLVINAGDEPEQESHDGR